MNNQQQDASAVKVNVVMLDTERYEDLLYKEQVYFALYTAGVDNWEWYDEAMKEVNDSAE